MLCPICNTPMETVPGSVEETAHFKMFTEKCPRCGKSKSHTWKKAQPSRGSSSGYGRPTKGNAYGGTNRWGR